LTASGYALGRSSDDVLGVVVTRLVSKMPKACMTVAFEAVLKEGGPNVESVI
jgi:hypothetical protein